ncbi:MAG: hypothetical protein IT363_04065 [Methanoregulaceae archaeon]|nr:hypothetical protein [Methanoregulaceae archaeon]
MLNTPEAQVAVFVAIKAFGVGMMGVLFFAMVKKSPWWIAAIPAFMGLVSLGSLVAGLIMVAASPLAVPYIAGLGGLTLGAGSSLLATSVARARHIPRPQRTNGQADESDPDARNSNEVL